MKTSIKNKHKIKKILFIAVALIAIALCYIFVMEELIEKDGAWKPDYTKVSLSKIINKDSLTAEDYRIILMQTGLGKPAVDELITKYQKGSSRVKLFEEFQRDFFLSGDYVCRQIGIITSEEKIRNEEGELKKGFAVADLREGDILITKATHSLGWRHGHAAIVINGSTGETLEAVLLGYDSMKQSVEKWRSYPSFMVLRLKDGQLEDAKKIAEFAQEELQEIPYGLFTGIPDKSPETIQKTQCSHLVWYPYNRFGYDTDSDGSWLVTPKDIANSDLFEIVQVYGVNPEDLWP